MSSVSTRIARARVAAQPLGGAQTIQRRRRGEQVARLPRKLRSLLQQWAPDRRRRPSSGASESCQRLRNRARSPSPRATSDTLLARSIARARSPLAATTKDEPARAYSASRSPRHRRRVGAPARFETLLGAGQVAQNVGHPAGALEQPGAYVQVCRLPQNSQKLFQPTLALGEVARVHQKRQNAAPRSQDAFAQSALQPQRSAARTLSCSRSSRAIHAPCCGPPSSGSASSTRCRHQSRWAVRVASAFARRHRAFRRRTAARSRAADSAARRRPPPAPPASATPASEPLDDVTLVRRRARTRSPPDRSRRQRPPGRAAAAARTRRAARSSNRASPVASAAARQVERAADQQRQVLIEPSSSESGVSI